MVACVVRELGRTGIWPNYLQLGATYACGSEWRCLWTPTQTCENSWREELAAAIARIDRVLQAQQEVRRQKRLNPGAKATDLVVW